MYYVPKKNLIQVVLAKYFDLTYISTEWMEDPDLPDNEVLIPSLDIVEEKFNFEYTAEGRQAAERKMMELYAAQLNTEPTM